MANVVVLGVGAAGEVTARLLAGDRSIDRLRLVDVRQERLGQGAPEANGGVGRRPAILGMGVAPGITNLLTRRVAEQLDRIDAIRIRVYGSGYVEVDGHVFAPLFSPETLLEEVLWPAP